MHLHPALCGLSKQRDAGKGSPPEKEARMGRCPIAPPSFPKKAGEKLFRQNDVGDKRTLWILLRQKVTKSSYFVFTIETGTCYYVL